MCFNERKFAMKRTLTLLAATLAFAAAHAADVSGGGSKSGSLKPAPRQPVYPPKDSPDAVTKNFA
ncbi:MAG: hypothetical protein EAZ24_11785, partial [Burkholderiales bacterium]